MAHLAVDDLKVALPEAIRLPAPVTSSLRVSGAGCSGKEVEKVVR